MGETLRGVVGTSALGASAGATWFTLLPHLAKEQVNARTKFDQDLLEIYVAMYGRTPSPADLASFEKTFKLEIGAVKDDGTGRGAELDMDAFRRAALETGNATTKSNPPLKGNGNDLETGAVVESVTPVPDTIFSSPEVLVSKMRLLERQETLAEYFTLTTVVLTVLVAASTALQAYARRVNR